MNSQRKLKIACLAWGSLEWRPETLKVDLPWKEDGPMLPVEYVRVSEKGHLTLVLTETGALIRVLWSTMSVDSLDEAIESLRFREGEKLSAKKIGRWPSDQEYLFSDVISTWAASKGMNAVIWTALPAKFRGVNGCAPSAEEALKHLSNLQGDALACAEEYIRKTPLAVRTPYRDLFENKLGWYPEKKED